MSIKDKKYNAEKQTFDGLEYPITQNTNILYMSRNVNMFTDFDPECTYSFDVLSYDKDKNARLIIITDMYKSGMEFFTNYNNYCCYTIDENGKPNRRDCDDKSLFDNIPANSMIEFTYNENDGIKSAKVVEGTEFQGYTYDKDKNTFGKYNLADVSLLTVEFNEKGYIATYEPFIPDDKFQYNGKIFTSSYGKKVLWITGSETAPGNPIVEFWARNVVARNKLSFGATYDKNGYTGSGKIYLAVYYQGRLCCAYTYSLTHEGSVYDEEYEELTSVIDEIYFYEENNNPDDYTITGFVWYDNLMPMYPAAPVKIRTFYY